MWQYEHIIQGLNFIQWQSLVNCCWTSWPHGWTSVRSNSRTCSLLLSSQFSFVKSSRMFDFSFFFLRRTFESKSAEAWSLLKPTSVLQVEDDRTSVILPTRVKIRRDNEPWQLLNGNSVWANGQEERSHNALISDNNLHASSCCTFSQITRRQQVPVFSLSVLPRPCESDPTTFSLMQPKLTRVTEQAT